MARVLRVPGGYMRDKTQARIEEVAADHGATVIDLALVEEGIEHGRRMMAEMMAGYQAQPPAGSPRVAEGGNGNGGGHSAAHGEAAADGNGGANGRAAEACPVDHAAAEPAADDAATDSAAKAPAELALNEVSVMSEVERRRRGLQPDATPGDPAS